MWGLGTADGPKSRKVNEFTLEPALAPLVLMRVLDFAGRFDADARSHARAGGEPFSLPACSQGNDPRRPMKTKAKPKKQQEQEPVGIVISGGPVREEPPAFSAYVWAAAPERTRKGPGPKVA